MSITQLGKYEIWSHMQVEIGATFIKAVLMLEIRENCCHLPEHLCKIYFPLVTKFIPLPADRLLCLVVRVSFD